MKERVKRISVVSLLLALATMPVVAADNLINEPSFENTVHAGVFGDYTFMVDIDPNTGLWNEMTGWAGTFGDIDITGIPESEFNSFATPYGSRAIRISTASSNRVEWWPPIAFVRPNFRTEPAWWNPNDLASIDRVAVSPGDEVYASARIFTDAPLVNGQFGMIKVAFFDANGLDISPSVISQGEFDALIEELQCSEFPGARSTLKLDGASTVNEWLKAQVQATAPIVGNDGISDALFPTCKDWNNDGVYNPDVVVSAPPGAVEMNVFLFNIDPALTGNPIYFDDVFLGILSPDDDGDRIENRVDSDPINPSLAFSDGTTSGTVVGDIDTIGILAIDDAEEQLDGISIVYASGTGSPIRVRVCDSTASINIRAGSDLVVTCGSVILDVAPGSEPVTLEIELNGEPATVEVPPENTVTFEPEEGSLSVGSTSTDSAPVVLAIGDSIIAINSGEKIELPSLLIDIKPGSDPNCFRIDGNGVIPVAILGSNTLAVDDVDVSTLDFSGLVVRVKGDDNPSCGKEDTNGDGHPDLVCHFLDDPSTWSPGSAYATVSGALLDGTPISGTDSICLVP